ncbi:hypothetical protein [Rhizobium sp. Root483D2]|uniref:hypothetical protein n=1 Tax=Rhizobium sp. Root483D2 TaxID=1736545 RepID=UPI00071558C1|nr:hypothetical protein [Rhizobium sp. Root483D2]KQY20763.1 hypothetical protein ASD32_04935 [Rhizobium sp. Root483D2]
MDKFLEVVGIAIVLLTLGALLLLVAGAQSPLILLPALPWAIPSIIGGVVIAAFGSMLGQLKAIRDAAERQAAILQRMLNNRNSN